MNGVFIEINFQYSTGHQWESNIPIRECSQLSGISIFVSRGGHPGNHSKIHSLNWYSVLPFGTYRFKNDTKQVNPYPNKFLQIYAENTVTNCILNPAELRSNYCITIKEMEHLSRTTTIIAMKLRKNEFQKFV